MPRQAAYKFYLAIFALFGAECVAKPADNPTPSSWSPDICAHDPKAKVSDACASYADLDSLNSHLQPFVRSLANDSDFFSYYRLNLFNKECPFWNDESGMCGNIACAVTTVDNEQDLPSIWRAEELSKLEGPKARHPGRKEQKEMARPLLGKLGDGVGESCVVEYDDECDDRDYCVPEDESATAKGDYVSLANNPERYTGYAGEGAHHVWEAIYNENCFSSEANDRTTDQTSGLSMPAAPFFQNQALAQQDFKQVIKAHDRKVAIEHGHPGEDLDSLDECLEKRVFYRVISGMHASISMHLCHDYLNQTTGEWGPNLQCYKERLHEHPERISNIYFNYALMLRAVGKLKDYVQDYTFCTGDPVQDKQTKVLIQRLAQVIPSGPEIFDENVMFQDQTASGMTLKEDFRNRFRNVSRIMDCVGCDKCRLWGKIQTAGFGTALKVLFEFGKEEDGLDKPLLRRHELVALINTLDKISSALKALEEFRNLVTAEILTSSTADTATRAPNGHRGNSSQDDLADADDDFASDRSTPAPNPDDPTISESFWSEFELVYRTAIWVLKSWVRLPVTFGRVLLDELSRAFDFWLGRPVKPRTWGIHVPTRDEL